MMSKKLKLQYADYITTEKGNRNFSYHGISINTYQVSFEQHKRRIKRV